MFPWFGTLKAQGDAAALLAEAKYQSFLDARNQLFYQVAAAYHPLYELTSGKRLNRKTSTFWNHIKTLPIQSLKTAPLPWWMCCGLILC
jgi:outer membrane protein, heavy metal efflux system